MSSRDNTEQVKIKVGPFLLKCEVSPSGVRIEKIWWLRIRDYLTYESKYASSENPKAVSHLESFLWLQFGDEITKLAKAEALKERA